jgi:hypothetical protein
MLAAALKAARMPTVVNRFIRDDGLQVIGIVEREDGRFSLVEEREAWIEGRERDSSAERYWTTVQLSASHDTLQAAQREVAAKFGWARSAES